VSIPRPNESAAEALSRFRADMFASKNGIIKSSDGNKQSNSTESLEQNAIALVNKQRRGSTYIPKTIKVRHPVRARSKSITLPDFQAQESKNFPISRLNNYDPVLKKHRGSVVSI